MKWYKSRIVCYVGVGLMLMFFKNISGFEDMVISFALIIGEQMYLEFKNNV